jgi:hypothetical protein
MRVELREFPVVNLSLLWDDEKEKMRAVHIEVDILKLTGSLISDPIPPGDGSKGRRLTFHEGTHPSAAVTAVQKILSGYCLPLVQQSAGVWTTSDVPSRVDPSPRQGEQTMRFYFRPECGREGRMGPDIGPFDSYLQLTYGELTCEPEDSTDNVVAAWDQTMGDWFLNRNNPTVKRCTKARDGKLPWSDLVIFVSSS